MESMIPMSGFQLPFQRRLSRLYNDTKERSDFVKEPVQSEDDPEIKDLYRRLRIQKDRFVSWGLEWSDPNHPAGIDESLSRAGMSEVAGSVMSTIKDILAEAEPLWLSSKRAVESKRASPDSKAPRVQWDKDRFKDLTHDLTASIDTLYDLSRARSSAVTARLSAQTAAASKASGEGDYRPFGSTRMQTPRQIDPKTLTHLQPRQDGAHSPPAPREVVYMSKTAYSELTRGTASQPWAPLLLEYAPFDPIYSTTGIMPPMARFEKLSAGLQRGSQRAPTVWTGLPRLFGYFEDMDNSRLGLVYHFPPSFSVLASDGLTQNPQYSLFTLGELLCAELEPSLEAKFRLAYNLSNTIFDMHARGITHGNLVDTNISFCRGRQAAHAGGRGQIDVRHPLLSSFDVFPEDSPPQQRTMWRHPSDPRSGSTSPPSTAADERVLELYSLAVLLVSIGLWTKPEKLFSRAALPSIDESTLDQLSLRCGTLYMKAVDACRRAVDDELSGADGDALLSSVQMRVMRCLEACCILDGVSGLEDPLELQPTNRRSATTEKPSSPKEAIMPSEAKKPVAPQTAGKEEQRGTEAQEAPTKDPSEAKTKVRLYPHVPLPPDVIEKWNGILMPQINKALGGFYRKHPESVEISLESVGPSAHQTRPTVLVVCSSVGKVRSILNKKLGELFDESTGFSLKVCRGQMIRSRRQATPASRAMASKDGEDFEAANPDYQERPSNGASIGAWIGDRHLPPVSFGGLVVVDGKTYGMTVHHMIDDPERDSPADTMRSSALPGGIPVEEEKEDKKEEEEEDEEGECGSDSFSEGGMMGYELSGDDSDAFSETDGSSDYDEDEGEDEDDEDEDEDEDGEYEEAGDIPGVEPGCGEGYIVTQPALDDVEAGFYPCAETQDEDHLDTFRLGELYASSGIRRKHVDGLLHEVDWALFAFAEGRRPDSNSMPSAGASGSAQSSGDGRLQPRSVAPWSALPGMKVQCAARTSGLQVGQIQPALTSVKIYGRTSPSHTYQVVSATSVLLGIPGDSGAWIVDREEGRLCGHVLAWSMRKRVAYMCPMEVLLQDMAETLDAQEVRLPGGESMVYSVGSSKTVQEEEEEEEVEEEHEEEHDAVPALVKLSSSVMSMALGLDAREMPSMRGRRIGVTM